MIYNHKFVIEIKKDKKYLMFHLSKYEAEIVHDRDA